MLELDLLASVFVGFYDGLWLAQSNKSFASIESSSSLLSELRACMFPETIESKLVLSFMIETCRSPNDWKG